MTSPLPLERLRLRASCWTKGLKLTMLVPRVGHQYLIFSGGGYLKNCFQPCDEYLEMISTASFDAFDVQDREGWSIMHRASTFGTTDDIVALPKKGAFLDLQRLNFPGRLSFVLFNLTTFYIQRTTQTSYRLFNARRPSWMGTVAHCR